MKGWVFFSLILLLVTASLSACGGKAGSAEVLPGPAGTLVPVISPEDPYAWFDKPLEGFTLTQAPYEVVFHGSAYKGIARVQLYIEGQLVVDAADPAPGETLVTVKYTWTPPRPGRYLLRAQTSDSDNQQSTPALTTVIVIGPPTVTPTRTPTATPTPAGGALTFSVLSSVSQFYYGGPQCGPRSVSFEVQVSDPARVHDVLLFFHLQDKVSGKKTDWNKGVDMHAQGNGRFSFTLESASIQPRPSYHDSLFLYQFVGTDAASQVLGRSPVYSNIVLSSCGPIAVPMEVHP